MADKMADKTLEDIMASMKKDPFITISKLSNTLNISVRTIERCIRNLKSSNKIVRKGGKKVGVWEVL